MATLVRLSWLQRLFLKDALRQLTETAVRDGGAYVNLGEFSLGCAKSDGRYKFFGRPFMRKR